MIVVGGTYQESCRDPRYSALIGSGVRAAGCLAAVDHNLGLRSAVEPAALEVAQATAAALRIGDAQWSPRSGPVGFAYETPLSSPRLYGGDAVLESPVVGEGEAVLLFGMVEGAAGVSATSLVVDPQHDIALEAMAGFPRQRLAVVASGAELVRLAGGLPVAEAARAVLGASRSDVVVAKLGAVGALVVADGTEERVGPVPTGSVWPIGSGDAFSAGFAWAWAANGADPVEAAEVGSATAAAWCSTRSMPVVATAMEVKPPPPPRSVRVYLAGPFFDVAQRWLVELCATALRQLGADVFSPFHEVGVGIPDAAAQDLDALGSCDVVLALLDGADPGTVFEVGWARRAGMPVVVYCQRCSEEDLTMVGGSGSQVFSDLSSAVYAAAWAAAG